MIEARWGSWGRLFRIRRQREVVLDPAIGGFDAAIRAGDAGIAKLCELVAGGGGATAGAAEATDASEVLIPVDAVCEILVLKGDGRSAVRHACFCPLSRGAHIDEERFAR